MVEQFDLRPNAASNDELLYYDSASAIICAVGSRYKSYCSNIARTFLIDATSSQSKAYEVLFKAHNAAISELKPGKKVSAAYQAALAVVEKEAPELVSNLTKSAGTGIGLEFRESGGIYDKHYHKSSKQFREREPDDPFVVSLGSTEGFWRKKLELLDHFTKQIQKNFSRFQPVHDVTIGVEFGAPMIDGHPIKL
ncbi:hypothetical protein ACFX15_032567 [Malus domestica]